MRRHQKVKKLSELSREEKYEVYARALIDFHYFCEVMLGYHDMNDEHFALCNFLQADKRFKMVLMPRNTFKSCVADAGYALWRLVRDPNLRILIYSDSASKAQGFLQDIKYHIEGKAKNSRFREFFDGWETGSHDGKWNEHEIVVSQRSESVKEPSIDTGGIETSKVGKHYDLILFDDIVSDLNVTTKAQMDKVHDCYKKALSLLRPGGDVVMIGTRWHFSDAYGRIIAENAKHGTFSIFKRKAEIRDELLFNNCGPQSLTREFLDQQKREQGSYIYSCLYQNEPVDDESAMFKQENFEFYGKLEQNEKPREDGLYSGLYVTGTLDPSGMGEDYTAGTICGTDADGRLYVLELLFQKHCSPSYMIEWIMRMNRKYKIRMFGVETTFFRGMLEKELEKSLRDEAQTDPFFHNFGIKKFQTRWRFGEGKATRIKAMMPYHERKDILFPGESLGQLRGHFGDLAYQMMQCTPTHMPEPNDLLDALSWQLEIVQKGGRPVKAEVVKGSPAWIEQRSIYDHNRMQRRLPRRFRKFMKPSLS